MSDDNTKDWANIRIEEPVRDAAQDDPRTYTEIMRAGLDADARGGSNPGDVQAQLDEIQRTVEQNNGALGDTVEQALNIGEHGFTDIVDRLERIESAASTAEERTGSIENTLEELSR